VLPTSVILRQCSQLIVSHLFCIQFSFLLPQGVLKIRVFRGSSYHSISSTTVQHSLTEAKHMAHIAAFMVATKSSVGLNNYIAREVSPSSSQDGNVCTLPKYIKLLAYCFQTRTATQSDEKETYVWRMHQPSESRKYQLFPAKDKLSITPGRKSPDPETVLNSTMGQVEKDRSIPGSTTRAKPKEQTLIRRRKVSVPELGPMTTVQEIAMDSRESIL